MVVQSLRHESAAHDHANLQVVVKRRSRQIGTGDEGDLRVGDRHLGMEGRPNARGPLIIDSMLRIGYAIFSIGTLGFLGLGLPPPAPDWGGMISEARKYIWTSPLNVLWPALAISSLVVGLNLFADGLREESTRYQ